MSKLNKKSVIVFYICFIFSQINLFGFEYVGYRWSENNMPTFYINENGTPDCSEEFQAIENSIQTWNNVSTTYLDFKYGGITSNNNARTRDDTNLIVWVESGWDILFPGEEYENAGAVATTWYYISSGTAIETDISFNGEDHQWATNGSSSRIDVQNIGTHEFGHPVGLADLYDSGDTEKTMYGYASAGETKKRSLHTDDINGARYVNFGPTTSGTLQENEVWIVSLDGNIIDIVGVVTVPSGVTLDIKPNATINFTGLYRISVYGTLKADNVTFTANNPGDWYDLRFYTGSDNSYLRGCLIKNSKFGVTINESDIEVYDCDFQNGVSRNIYISGSSAEPTIEKCDVEIKNNHALYIIQGANPVVKNNKFYSDNYDAHTIMILYSKGIFTNNSFNTLSDIGKGIYISGSTSEPDFSGKQDGSGNLFGYLYCESQVVIKGGNPNFGFWDSYGWNKFPLHEPEPGYYFIENWTTNTINAIKNCWHYDCSWPDDSEFYGDVEWYLPLSIEPQPVGALWKSNQTDDPILEEFKDAFMSYSNKNYASAIAQLKNVFNKYPDHYLAHQALYRLCSAYKMTDTMDQNMSFINGIIHGNQFDERCKKVARGWLADYYAQKGDMKSAEKIILLSPKGSLSERELLLDLISDYSLIGDKENANRIANLMRERHHDKDVEEDIEIALELEPDFELDKEKSPPETTNIPENMILVSTPNPFNLSTSITFYVKDAGFVEIKIFDILGREVKTLVNDHRKTGVYTVNWNGKNNLGLEVPSGVYIYTFQAGGKVYTKKVTFLK